MPFQLQVLSCFSNDIRSDPLLRYGIGNQKSIVTEYINEPGKPLAIVGDFLDGIRRKKLLAFITYRTKPVVNKGAYLFIVKSFKPALNSNTLF